MKKTRIWELDFVRGFAIIMMIFDHLMYDLKNLDSYFYNFNLVDNGVFNWLSSFSELYWNSELRFFGHFFFVSVFLIVSGISFTFSKSNLSRANKLMIVAVLISVVTFAIEYFTGMQMFIIFGVIHMYAFSTFLTYLFRKIWDNDVFIFTIGAGILILGVSLEFWELHYISKITWDTLPGIIIGTKAFGADYFGLIPYLGIIMIGTVIGNLFYKNKVTLLPKVKLSEKNVFIFAGRKSLIIFLTHQFILMGLIIIVGYILGYRI
ncbi:heparan-alpha-glucosaminide N-acetyltransferase domain-containing protein [Mycoplasmatota bacterium WC30]